ncbi:hypothetical protein T261_01302 [Streptomyces lydicus]|nr:hypothetical protein T261_01302 [Streptomyces lydicus]
MTHESSKSVGRGISWALIPGPPVRDPHVRDPMYSSWSSSCPWPHPTHDRHLTDTDPQGPLLYGS